MRLESGQDDFLPAIRSGAPVVSARPSLSYWQDAWLRLKSNRQALGSLVIVLGLLFFTLFGPLFWSVDPSAQEMGRISEPPSFGRRVVVLPEEDEFTETVLPEMAESPTANAADLPAPSKVEVTGAPSTQAVRLRWSAVPGASGYSVYRDTVEPKGKESLGVPISQVEGGNHVSYEDRFDLGSRTYFYTVVARNGDESPNSATLRVKLEPGIRLSEANSLDPAAKPGDLLRLSTRPLGTDYLGRDLLARLMIGARVSLFIGFVSPLLFVFLGVLVGGVAGFHGGRIDGWLMRITDFVMALPFLLFMILFKVAFGAGPGQNGILSMLVALVALSWTGAARLIRGQVLQLRGAEFVQAARLLGARPFYLITRHLLPNTLGLLLVELTFAVPVAIFTEAFLSFIGMGVVPPTPSWGSMCNDGIKTFLVHPHEFVSPALMISVTVLAFNLLGDGLRDALDPKMRSR